MNHSVRSLLPSLLLIGIYFIADEFFGTVTGVWVAFLLGGAEFIYTRIREKVYDKMIVFLYPGSDFHLDKRFGTFTATTGNY